MASFWQTILNAYLKFLIIVILHIINFKTCNFFHDPKVFSKCISLGYKLCNLKII